jgi:hypothetical protein
MTAPVVISTKWDTCLEWITNWHYTELRGYFTLKSLLHSGLGNKWCPLMRVTLHFGECKSGPCSGISLLFFWMSLMWSWHWSPLTQTSLLLSPSDGLASFLENTLANGVKVVEKVITSKFRFHLRACLIAIYALRCFCNFSCTPVPKLPWRAPRETSERMKFNVIDKNN